MKYTLLISILALPFLSLSQSELSRFKSGNGGASFGGFGTSITQLNYDLNNNGYPEFVVGAPGEFGFSPAGAVYIYDPVVDTLIASLSTPSHTYLQQFGYSLSSTNQTYLKSDTPNLIVGARQYNNPGFDNSGRVFVFNILTFDTLFSIASPQMEENGRFGHKVNAINDINGDGKNDIVVSAPGESSGSGEDANVGRVYIFSGTDGSIIDTINPPISQDNGQFGFAVDIIDDINNDGFQDIIIGSPYLNIHDSTNAGAVFIFSGQNRDSIKTLSIANISPNSNLGFSVSKTDDITGDDIPDILVGAPGQKVGGSSAGKAHLFNGGNGNHVLSFEQPIPLNNSKFGASVNTIKSDVNQDGINDLIIGAPNEFHEDGQGITYLFDGASSSLISSYSSINPYTDNGKFGHAIIPYNFDLNGDSINEILIGAPEAFIDNGSTQNGIVLLTSIINKSPLAEIDAPDTIVICDKDSIVLSNVFNAPFSNFQWFRDNAPISNDTLYKLIARTSGNYQVSVSNQCCDSLSNTVTVIFSSQVSISSNDDLNFCTGDSAILEADSINLATYSWYKNDTLISATTTRFLTVMSSGLYAVEVTQDTCSYLSPAAEVIEFTQAPQGVINVIGDSIFCDDDSTLLSTFYNRLYTYQWLLNDDSINNADSSTFIARNNGNYTVKVSNGCFDAIIDQQNIFVHSALIPEIATIDTINEGNTIILSTDSIIGYTFQWIKNDASLINENNATYHAESTGIYKVRVTNTCGIYTSDPISLIITSIQELAPPNTPLAVYDIGLSALFIKNLNINKKTRILIMNALGQNVFEKQVSLISSLQIDLAHLKSGYYMAIIETDNNKHSYKVVKH